MAESSQEDADVDPESMETREEIDWDKFFYDLEKWLDADIGNESRFKRLWYNSMHIFLGIVTVGAYWFVYIAWFFMKFVNQIDWDDYKVTVYVDVEEPE